MPTPVEATVEFDDTDQQLIDALSAEYRATPQILRERIDADVDGPTMSRRLQQLAATDLVTRVDRGLYEWTGGLDVQTSDRIDRATKLVTRLKMEITKDNEQTDQLFNRAEEIEGLLREIDA